MDDQDLSDVLNRLRPQYSADVHQKPRTRLAIVRGGLDLDQFVTVEIGVDFAQDGRRQPFLADDYHRVQGVRACLEGLALRGRESGSRGGAGWGSHALF